MGILDVFIGIFTGDWDQARTGVKEIFSGIWEGITGLFTNVIDQIRGMADVILGWFGTSWNEGWSSISSIFTGTWTGISMFFSGIMTGMNSWLAALFCTF